VNCERRKTLTLVGLIFVVELKREVGGNGAAGWFEVCKL